MKRRLFSILLALCMTLAMLPAAAFAKSVSYNGEIIIENLGWLFLNNDEIGYYIPGKNGKFSVNQPNSGSFLKVTKTGENEITITVFGNVTLQGKIALSANDENAIKSIKNLIITGATDGKNTLSLSTTKDGTAISVLGDLTVTGIALTATADNGPALRANNITVSDATLIATNNSADSAAIQAMQGDGPLGNLTVSGTSAITVTNKNTNGRAIHATIINGNETPRQTDASQVTISSPAPHSHVCSDGWTSDATGHWHRCADANCTEKLNFAAHSGGTATCSAKKKCEVCSQSYGELNPSNHTDLSGWASDETHHWKTCSACNTDIEKATHTGGTATCTAKKKCEVCGQSYSEPDPNNHTHLSGWASDETHHWKDCADCNATGIDNAAHTFDDWIIDKEPTATEAGLKHRTCSVCHYKETATIPSVPCTHEGSTTWEPANDGVHHVKKCAACGAIIEKTAHSGGTATCTEAKRCEVCGEPYGEPSPSNHTALSDWKFDETGHWKTCNDCGAIIEKTAHTGGAATCNAKKKCEVCGEPYGELGANNHTALSGWASDETHHWKTCSACNTDIEKTAHTGDAATCTEAKKCEICSQSYGDLNPSNHTALSGWASDETDHWKVCADCKAADIDKAIHAYSDWIIDKEATATEAGAKCRECSVCHYKETATIPSVPCTHEGSTWEPADDGVHHVKKCTVCGAELDTGEHNFAYCDNMDGFHSMTCDVCGEARIEPHDFGHKTVPVNDGKHRGQCVCGAFDAAEEHAFENGSCTACGAADPTPAKPTPGGSGIIITPEAADPAFLSGANQTVAAGSAAVFRIDYNYATFRSVAVDGVILTPANYTTWDGSTWVKLTAACTKSLTPGTHTLSVYFDGATAATTFSVGGQPNPATGARDAVGIAVAAAVIALLGSAALLRKK